MIEVIDLRKDQALDVIRETIKKHNLLKPKQTVIVGISGGADSVVLARVLYLHDYNVICVHVEHGIRGEESLRDAEFVQRFCDGYGLKLYIEHINVPALAKKQKTSIENAARIARYKIFEKYSKMYDDAPIAVAHHKLDQAETVLLHLSRGCGLTGLCGMKYKNGKIIRPMLDLDRYTLENYIKLNKIEYVVDSTNFLEDYTRNKIRNTIIPYLNHNLSVDFADKLVSCANIMHDYRRYFDELIDEYEKDFRFEDYSLYFEVKSSTPRVILIEIIQRAINVLHGSLVDITKAQLDEIYALVYKPSGKRVQLPVGITIKKVYNKLVFSKWVPYTGFEYDFVPGRDYSWYVRKVYTRYVTEVTPKPRYEEYAYSVKPIYTFEHIDVDKLPKGKIVLRTRRSRDFIYPLGAGGKCTLKKYMIDKKFPEFRRDFVPVLAHNNEVFAVIGLCISEKVKIDENTTRIVKITEEF